MQWYDIYHEIHILFWVVYPEHETSDPGCGAARGWSWICEVLTPVQHGWLGLRCHPRHLLAGLWSSRHSETKNQTTPSLNNSTTQQTSTSKLNKKIKFNLMFFISSFLFVFVIMVMVMVNKVS